jgi:molecular chaperone DnaJ
MIRLELTLEEAVSGTGKDITVDTAVVCSACSGSGWGTTPRRCEACAGRGEKEETRRGPLEEMRRSFLGRVAEALACPTCQGRGIAGPRWPECDGPGRVRARRGLTLKIPPGVGNGTRIQLAGQAEVGPGGGEPGDLYVEVVELPHRIFQRRGDDLHCTVTIPRATAITGGVIQVDTLDGTTKVRIPQGTRHDRTLRLADLGAAHLSAGGRGDLLIHLETGN